MNESTFNYIVGKKGKSEYLKDSDGDGVINILDCKPEDKARQGLMHTVGAWAARKVGAEETAEKIEARGKQVDETRDAAREERWKQERETAVYKEQVKAEAQRKSIKQSYEPKPKSESKGSGFGGFVNSFSQIKTKPNKGKKVTTYVKQGKHYIKKTHYVKSPSVKDNNRDGVPDIFGVRSDRNRDGIPDILGIHNKNNNKPKKFTYPKFF